MLSLFYIDCHCAVYTVLMFYCHCAVYAVTVFYCHRIHCPCTVLYILPPMLCYHCVIYTVSILYCHSAVYTVPMLHCHSPVYDVKVLYSHCAIYTVIVLYMLSPCCTHTVLYTLCSIITLLHLTSLHCTLQFLSHCNWIIPCAISHYRYGVPKLSPTLICHSSTVLLLYLLWVGQLLQKHRGSATSPTVTADLSYSAPNGLQKARKLPHKCITVMSLCRCLSA